jgi:serine protease Do
MKKKILTNRVGPLFAAVLTCALAGNAGWAAEPPSVAPEEARRYADALSEAFAHAADVIRPSVVTIHSLRKERPAKLGNGATRGEGSDSDELLRRFFGGRGVPQIVEPPQEAMGSGVIVSGQGDILTNNHVVNEADELSVRLNDGRELDATVVGTDPLTDIAVIRVKATDLPAATLGDSSKLRVGQWVVAAGNPFGLDNSITAGIISAPGRAGIIAGSSGRGVGMSSYEDFIQTDAAINPGNSGGPLINLHGEVVGINTAIASRTGGNMGIGFAVPSNMAKTVMTALVKDGQVTRGYLGVLIQPLTEKLAKSFDYESTDGALIGDVTAKSPAEKAGLQAGDIIVAVNGEKMKDNQQVRNTVAAIEPGTRTPVEVYRSGKKVTVTVEVGKLDTKELAAGNTPRDMPAELGLTVAELTADQAKALNLSDESGVIVTEVETGGAAARAGLLAGDVIVEVQGVKVTSAREFRQQLTRADLAKGVRLIVKSGGAQRFVFLQTKGK